MTNIFKFIKPNKKGQALVESAIVFAFVLIPLILGMLEFGWYFNGLITLKNAAREGARAASVHETNAFVEEKIRNSLNDSSLTYMDPVISLTNGGVQVDAYAEFEPLVGLYIKPNEGLDYKIVSASAIMRLE